MMNTRYRSEVPDADGDDIYYVFKRANEDIDGNPECVNRAPIIAYRNSSGAWWLVQGCCNSWQCPRCSQIRAKCEYWRITDGIKQLADEGEHLYFVTLTCRGKELTVKDADDLYLQWTNRLLTTWRTKEKRRSARWVYVAVTERQKRGHAHSHMIITTFPSDMVEFSKGDRLPTGIFAKHDMLYSQWLVDAAVKSGLGYAIDCTPVRAPDAVSRYVAKYLFKSLNQTLFPSHWRRVRYSREFPKPEQVKSEGAFPIVRYADWQRVAELGETVFTDSDVVLERAILALHDKANVKYKGAR